MEYLQIKDVFPVQHHLTYTETTREWFLGGLDSPAFAWIRLASLCFHRDPNLLPSAPIPVIEIENFKEEPFRYQCVMPDGRLIDFFFYRNLFLGFFVSERLKNLLEAENAEALFSEARINIDGEVYSEPYFHLSSRDMLDVFDKENSVYSFGEDDFGDLNLFSVEKVSLVESDIPEGQRVFFMNIDFEPLMIESELAKKISKAGMTGMDFISVDNMVYKG